MKKPPPPSQSSLPSKLVPSAGKEPLSRAELRWRCDPEGFGFSSTADIEPADGVLGQETALEALRFGLEIDAPGQNVFVRGLSGAARSQLVHRLVERLKPECPLTPDRCYVANFQQPDRPRLLALPRGAARRFRSAVQGLIQFLRKDLAPALSSDAVKARAENLQQGHAERMRQVTEPFEQELKEAGYGLLVLQAGAAARRLIVPLVEGEPAPPEKLRQMRSRGQIDEAQIKAWDEGIAEWNRRLADVGENVAQLQVQHGDEMQSLMRSEVKALLADATRPLRREFPDEEVAAFLGSMIDDVVERHLAEIGDPEADFMERYAVNVILSHDLAEGCPTVTDHTPSLQSLLGSVDALPDPDVEGVFAPHMLVRGGTLLRADGGFLILDANDLLAEPGAYRALTRTLRTGLLEFEPTPGSVVLRTAFVKPEPIPVKVKVVLLGDANVYYLLDAHDADFRALFKVLSDFEPTIPRTAEGLRFYAGNLARLAREEKLLHFGKDAVAALCEHGARIASEAEKLTTRFGRLSDIAREAVWLAQRRGEKLVSAPDVRGAVQRTKDRGGGPSRRFQELIARNVIRIQTDGVAVGQVNGLAIIQAGQLTYGFPNRITAAIGPGRAGTINVERESRMSGPIHTKGFLILGGLMRSLLPTEHPLTFTASITFEQSYGGVDGDSASGIEFCCLISALTGLPVRQDLAMTGAIDQVGNVLAIGGVNEKIEGFYDACKHHHYTGTQGVIIPQANAGDLMLREDIVEACDAQRFRVYSVSRIEEALTLLTGIEAGGRGLDGSYPEGTVLAQATLAAERYWERATERAH